MDNIANKISDNNLEEFKKLVRKSIFLDHKNSFYFDSIPNSMWKKIFNINFGGNWNYAQRVLLRKFKDIESIDTARVDKEKYKIFNLSKCTDIMIDFVENNKPIIFLTDYDNDGSLSQSVINEFLKIDNEAEKISQVHYASSTKENPSRGFTLELLNKIIDINNINTEEEFLIVTADNGINSLVEQKRIEQNYPKAKIIVTDHHNPDSELCVQENENLTIFNPHYKPTQFFTTFNISGATTIATLLLNVLNKRFEENYLSQFKSNIDNIKKLSKVSNLLDYVATDPADKPEKDYIVSKFLSLQPLLNVTNSVSKMINQDLSAKTIKSLLKKIPNINLDVLNNEIKNIKSQNQISKILLSIYNNNKTTDVEKNKPVKIDDTKDPEPILDTNNKSVYKVFERKNKDYLDLLFLKELNEPKNYFEEDVINNNYIEQLRPLVFGITADDSKNSFMESLCNRMIQVFDSIQASEKKIANELRKGDVITKSKLKNSVISYADENILSIFNRKFLNKVYNDENLGFSLTLDSVNKSRVSGSFRSLYNISSILKDKSKLEQELNIKIETPGHERAAGFIITSTNPKENPITKRVIDKVNSHINSSIEKIKKEDVLIKRDYLLTDLSAIKIINDINIAVRGNVSNFEYINPILKITKDTVWQDSYSTKQYSMDEIIQEKKYGYIQINIDFSGNTVIIPVELIRKMVANNYEDYLSLGFLDGGVFMADKIIYHKDISNIIDIRDKNDKTLEIDKVFEKDFKNTNIVHLSRDQIQDNPFFKYHDYGRLNFDLFEKLVIGIIDSNNIDMLSIFDVEAGGFANAKLMNLGSMNYFINPQSGNTKDAKEFFDNFYSTQRGDDFLLTEEQISELVLLSSEDVEHMSDDVKKMLLIKSNVSALDFYLSNAVSDEDSFVNKKTISYYYHPLMNELSKKNKPLPFGVVKNYIYDPTNDLVKYNREIQAEMLAFLVKDDDFKVSQEMTNLTGITQKLLDKHGKYTEDVDTLFSSYYSNKEILFGAHNTPYDARVLRANCPQIYSLLKSNMIYDSALFSKTERLSYDDVYISTFDDIDGIPNNIAFYNNSFSDFNLSAFIEEGKNNYYPDRTGNYLLSIENGEYFLVDKITHDINKIEATKEELLNNMITASIPINNVKYSVEKLSEQWMIHSLLLSDEKFNIQHVDLNDPTFKSLKQFESQLIFFQDNYHFDTNPQKNIYNFFDYYINLGLLSFNEKQQELFKDVFVPKFLSLNKSIQQKFSDAWIYKAVLSIKDPSNYEEITNDLIDLINVQTAIPKDKITTIFKDSIAFKKKHKIEHILHHEGHINGPWEGDFKGDVAFEDKLTLSLLGQRFYDPYNHSISKAIHIFNKFAVQAKTDFNIADLLSYDLPQDSYSYRQGLLYKRTIHSSMINNIQSREIELQKKSDNPTPIVFKLEKNVLPQNTFVCAIPHNNAIISREQIEEDSKKLSFILVNEQIKHSLHNTSQEEAVSSFSILEANDSTCLEYKKDLAKRYRYVEFNRKIYQIKTLLTALEKTLKSGVFDEKKRKKDYAVEYLGIDGINLVESLFNSYIELCSKHPETEFNQTNIKATKNHFADIKSFISKYPDWYTPSLEKALEDKTIKINTFKELSEPSFLNNIDILKEKPVKVLLDDHPHLNLLNNHIEYTSVLLKDDSTKFVKNKKVIK